MKQANIIVDEEARKIGDEKFLGVLFDRETPPDGRPIWIAGVILWSPGKDFRGEFQIIAPEPEGLTKPQQDAWRHVIEYTYTMLRHGRKFENEFFGWSKYLFT